jgi:hypothetical protein
LPWLQKNWSSIAAYIWSKVADFIDFVVVVTLMVMVVEMMGGPLIEPMHCWICSDIQHFQPSVVLNQEHHSLVHALPRLGYVHHLIPLLSSPQIQRMVESNHVRQMKVVGVPHSLQSICKTQVGHLQWKNHSRFPINLHDIITLLDISASWGSLTFLQWKESKSLSFLA